MSSSPRRALAALAGDRRGAVAVEFAIVGLIFITLLIGATDIARYQFLRQSLHSMAQEGAREALVMLQGGACSGLSVGALKTAVTTPNPTPMLIPANLTLVIACPALSSTGVQTVQITATYPFTRVAPVVPMLPALTATAALSY